MGGGGQRWDGNTGSKRKKTMLFHGQRAQKHCPYGGIILCNVCLPGGEGKGEDVTPCNDRQELKELDSYVIQPMQFVGEMIRLQTPGDAAVADGLCIQDSVTFVPDRLSFSPLVFFVTKEADTQEVTLQSKM